MDSESIDSSSPITPATSIIPPSTPPRLNSTTSRVLIPSTPSINPASDDEESQKDLEESPLLNSLQLSPHEQHYLNQISSAPHTPTNHNNNNNRPNQQDYFRSHKHTRSIPAYKFPSLRNFQSSATTSTSATAMGTRSTTPVSTPTSAVFESFKLADGRIITEAKKDLTRGEMMRYSVYVQNEDFEIYDPPPLFGKETGIDGGLKKKKPIGWLAGHGKSNSFGAPSFAFLKNHKKSKSDVVNP